MLSPLQILLAAAQAAAAQPPIIVTPEAYAVRVYSPREAVLEAADNAPRAFGGTFVMSVTRADREGDRVYLNSQSDYRDQRNLTINIDPAAVRELTQRFGAPPEQYFRGRLVAVTGLARRTRIDFIGNDGRRTDLYYFQTHVSVSRANQIRVFEDDTRARINRVQ